MTESTETLKPALDALSREESNALHRVHETIDTLTLSILRFSEDCEVFLQSVGHPSPPRQAS